MDICRREKPPYFKAEAEHEVACFLYDPGKASEGGSVTL
jgi:hypothetical protein